MLCYGGITERQLGSLAVPPAYAHIPPLVHLVSVTSDLSLSTGPKTSSVSGALSSHHSCTHRGVNSEVGTSIEGAERFLHTSQDVLKP